MKLCIETQAEGYAVYLGGQEPQIAATVDEALELARSLLSGGGQHKGQHTAPPMDGEQEFIRGFKGASGY